ncbi:MAG: ion transporter [Pseudomonadota bacterium]
MNAFQSARSRVRDFVESAPVRNGILGVIGLNAVLLGLDTSENAKAFFGGWIGYLDQICLAIFVVELVLKLFAFGWRFFTNAWNIFDFIVVGISLAPNGGGLSVLRALRILRVLRVISFAPSLRRVIEGFLKALPGMASVILLMAIIFYIGAVMATKLFGADFDEWFGTIGRSAYSLFQIMTLESWSMGIVRPVMKEYPYAWAFFVPFILVTTFAVVNLVVGLIVNSMQDAATSEEDEATDAHRDELMAKLEEISNRLEVLEKK